MLYEEDELDHKIETGNDLFGKFRYIPSHRKETERGILLEYFIKETGYEKGRVLAKIKGLSLEDLYYVKSVADKLMLEKKKENYQHAFNSVLYVPKPEGGGGDQKTQEAGS